MFKKILIGLVSGLICGLFTAGGGLILVPAFLYMLKMEPKKARAISVFCMLPMVMATAFFYGQGHFIDWQIGIKCAIGGVIGGILGAKLLNKIPDQYIRIAFIIFLIYAGIHMLIQS
ncbi:MAG: sulfite exporter TauE/SafE family protein [Clostridia bacterium]|nr:sulfite exporter TauE/SafE family protein [Clostridia bacterium]